MLTSTRSWQRPAIALLLHVLPVAQIAYGQVPVRDDGRMRDRYRSSYLHVDGRSVATSDRRVVSLRGVNIGGWLVIEDWMCGITDTGDTLASNGTAGVEGRASLETLGMRFGADGADALTDVWQDRWITAADLDRIHAGGFNLIRVPISYRTLQHADGSWIVDTRGRIDFDRMDWIVREAAARGIRTVFDLHIWPEQRRDYQKIGRPEGAAIRKAMAHLWTAVAAHYRGNGAIAAFDLINEFPGNWGVQQVLSDAVRKGDPRRMLVVEGYTLPEFRKLHAAGTFPNSMFSDHFYAAAPLATADIQARLTGVADSPVPVYIGEFLAADFPTARQAMDQAGVAWSSWTYKTVDMGAWGAFNYTADLRTDLLADTYQTIAAKWASLADPSGAAVLTPTYVINGDRLDSGHDPADPLPP